MTRVTIVTAFYNRCSEVDKTLLSLVGQTHKDIEVIIFDDCSTDGTSKKINDFIECHSKNNLKVIRPERNIGMTAGFIEAIRSASGDYIAIQGSGDVSDSKRIELQANVLDTHSEVCLTGCYYRNVVENLGQYRLRTPIADEMTLDTLLKGNIFSHGEVMFRKNTYIKAGGYRSEFKYAQDYDLWLRMIKLGKFFTVKEALYDRYVQMEGVSYNVRKMPLQARYSLLSKKLSKMPRDEADKIVSSLDDNYLLSMYPNEMKELQKIYEKSIITMAVWGNVDGAKAGIKDLVSSNWRAFVLSTIVGVMGSPIYPLIRHLVERASEMKPLTRVDS